MSVAYLVDSIPPSIHTLAPLESGGSRARQGFLFQDHVAARYCLEMVLYDEIQAVWCETLDDITVLRRSDGNEVAEFVQVKGLHPEWLWSISQLCHRKHASPGTSILEKSLANDRCKEPCTFTIVTTRDIRSDLRPLSLPHGEPSRSEALPGLAARLLGKLPDYRSPNGHNAEWWAHRTIWRVLHSTEAVTDHNHHLLLKLIETTGFVLFSDQIETVYHLLLQRIVRSSAADKTGNRHAGKLDREELDLWIKDRIKENYNNARNPTNAQLVIKLKAAGLDQVAINTATELRRSYRVKTLEPSYLQLDNVRAWENKVRGLLNRLRADLDTGAISDTGVDFHKRSLQALTQLHDELETGEPPADDILQGCMYHITALCQHRFTRPSI